MVVSKMPNGDRYQAALEEDLAQAGVDLGRIYWASALKCRNFDANASNADVKACKPYLDAEIEKVQPRYILSLGNEALLATTGHSGITKWRGKPVELGNMTIFPTISPAAVLARPQNRPGYQADLKFFATMANGQQAEGVKVITPDTILSNDDLRLLKVRLKDAKLVYFDIETNIVPLQEFDPRARVISMCGTYVSASTGEVGGFRIPLYHPESPWRTQWRSMLRHVVPIMAKIPIRIAHNGKFDCRWLRKHSGVHITLTFDTMIGVHLLDENVQKGLKPQGTMRLGVAPWGVDTKDLLSMPIEEVLEYNFLDTFYGYLIYLQVREELIAQPRLLRIMMKLLMPASNNLTTAEGNGVWLDVERLAERTPIAQAKLDEIENKVRAYIPDPSIETWPTNKAGKKVEVNLNASIFAKWLLFDHLGLPVLARGKEKPDGRPGDPSMAEGVLLLLNDVPKPHPVVQTMLDRIEWQKAMSSFFGPYSGLYDENQKVHTSFKLTGTVTGRLSSGKEDASKLSGRTSSIRGVNLQQVPRDPFIRGLFGASPGRTWIEADFSQVELRVAAFCAKERTMISLYQQGADIHMVTAMRMTGKAAKNITKEERKKAKPVNFGFLYGMGWLKFIVTAFNNYGVKFSEAEAKAYRKAYFDLYPDLLAWHERQRRLVHYNARVQSPIGRVRHLPDINSPDPKVRAEAERQAINSPVQGLASDMALAGMNLFVERLTTEGLSDKVSVLGLVHDAINIEADDDVAGRAMVLLKESMEDMDNMRRLFGLDMTVPIVADVKVGRHWGDSVELTEEQVYDFTTLDKMGLVA
jgi:DNA polymerase-1